MSTRLHSLVEYGELYLFFTFIQWYDFIRNVEVHQQIGQYQTLLQTVISRKLNVFGHICRMDDNCLVKTLMFGEMSGQLKLYP